MIRALVALQTSLCLEAILEPEANSPSAVQAFAMTARLGEMREVFLTEFLEKKNASLADYRFFQADNKRERLEQELEELLDPVETHWETLLTLKHEWLLRSRGVPSVLYVAVNDLGQTQEIFLPDR